MGLTVLEWYELAEKMTVMEHKKMQKTGDPIIRAALRKIVKFEGGSFGQVKQLFLEGDRQTISAVLSQIEAFYPGRFDAFAYCDGCRKFMLHEYDGPPMKLDELGHWPIFLGVPNKGQLDEA
ncbi:hypothetical protein [Acidithiobacillus ferriphilus]|uniref:hypothetical protein n=1 Tax=Acidithiobacillus ferriphilus TaxID=1689834 RepID=UPI001C0795FD|nr:hypothetical protein [Acidithiobacillus ferriphilus]MBU2852954.1 hypothetical protein [Acidithiobacillus ferriphilus]